MDKTYEAVIQKIRENAAYYETHRSHSAYADTAFQALKEMLEAFEEKHNWHNAYCGEGICCMSDCQKSQLRLTKHTTVVEYACQCGHSWTCNEYPHATYDMCPKCYRGNNPDERLTQLISAWHDSDSPKTLAEYLYLTNKEYAQYVQRDLSPADTLMIRNKRKYERKT